MSNLSGTRSDKQLVVSYVWREEKCFFISTIERDSSAAAYPMRFNETLMWEYDWEKKERGRIVGQYGENYGLAQHAKATEDFFRHGQQMEDE